MKKILFVINTMGRAGAEISFLNFLRKLEGKEYSIFLYVLMEQGEMIEEIPSYVQLLNPTFNLNSVLTKKGRKSLARMVLKAFFRNGECVAKLGHVIKNLFIMLKCGRIQVDKLFWWVAAKGALRFDEYFDLAVAWLEGGSAYYVAECVNARKKIAFIHIDYKKAGYTKSMDWNCWKHFERIFAVSEDAKEKFLAVYPEYKDRTSVFLNMVDQEYIRNKAKEAGGFLDDYDGIRILTVGRLTYQKGYDIAIEAMKLLKDSGYRVRWYVLGEGDQRNNLQKKIVALGLEKDFLLLGAVHNPYPYYAQADLYVHAVRYEGQGIAVWEAQTLGCAVIVSEYCGSEEQIENGKYGVSCELTPTGIADCIEKLLMDEKRRIDLGCAAAKKQVPEGQEKLFFELL